MPEILDIFHHLRPKKKRHNFGGWIYFQLQLKRGKRRSYSDLPVIESYSQSD